MNIDHLIAKLDELNQLDPELAVKIIKSAEELATFARENPAEFTRDLIDTQAQLMGELEESKLQKAREDIEKL